jgi:hypothetical protein
LESVQKCSVPDELFASQGDREWESAQAVARAAMTLAIAAAAKCEALEQGIEAFNKEIGE